MNYKRFKKATIWLALTCVLALPVAATFTPPVSAQGYHRRYDRRSRHYYRDAGGDDTRIAHGQDPATIGTDMDIFPE